MLFEDGSVTISLIDHQNDIVVKVKHDEFEIQYTYSKKSEFHTIEDQRRQAVLDAAHHLKEAGSFILNNSHKFSRGELAKYSIVL